MDDASMFEVTSQENKRKLHINLIFVFLLIKYFTYIGLHK